ncbi:NYN domain-containing protein [Lenzites betulinus]|nr:NYN domain-containing protein [Lenzites betulinus]
MNVSSNVAVFWDYENCALPATEPSYMIVNKIRQFAHQYGSVKSFKAYVEYTEQTSLKTMALRSELQSCGVSLIDCPHNGRKDVADKMMMVDMMAHAIDNPPPATIILISGDRDFVYAVSILSLRQYKIILLAPRNAHSGLKGQADAVYNWPDDFLPELPTIALSAASAPPPSGQGRRMSTLAATMASLERLHNQLLSTQMGPVAVPDHTPVPADPTPPATDAHGGDSSPNGPDINVDMDSSLDAVTDPAPQATARREESPSTSRDRLVDKEDGQVSSVGEPEPSWEDGEIIPHAESSAAPSQAHSAAQVSTQAPPAPAPAPVPVPVPASATLPSRPTGVLGFGSLNPSANPYVMLSPTSSSNTLVGSSYPVVSLFAGLSDLGNVHSLYSAQAPAPSASSSKQPKTYASVAVPEEDSDWQTSTRAAKKRVPAHVPAEFKPLVKVLKRQLAAGMARVESSQLGTLLSTEAAPLTAVYERAGVARLKEYTALAADLGIVTLSRESADGHNYIALHPVHRRKAVEHVWG